MEENKNSESQENGNTVKAWFEDNLRVLLSVLIVIAIAGGIYSYSTRTQAPTVSDLMEEGQDMTDMEMGDTENDQTAATDTTDDQSQQTEEKTVSKTPENGQVTSTETSRETEASFIESAQKGDGTTHLARRALANYLEKNPDSTLTIEHKIYIEDYLRKNSGHKGGLAIGSSVEFSKELIKGAIEKSKTLNEAQLNNLKRYSARVPSLK